MTAYLLLYGWLFAEKVRFFFLFQIKCVYLQTKKCYAFNINNYTCI